MRSRPRLAMIGFLLLTSTAYAQAQDDEFLEFRSPPLRAEGMGQQFECAIYWSPPSPQSRPRVRTIGIALRNAQGLTVAALPFQTIGPSTVISLLVDPQRVSPPLTPEVQPVYCVFAVDVTAPYFASAAIYQSGVGYTLIVPAQVGGFTLPPQ
jgi:hypothetical protein